MTGRVLVPHGPNPAAVTRRIEFREKDQRVTETAEAVNGKFAVNLDTPCSNEERFRTLLQKGKYVGDVRCHTVDGARIFFLMDRRPVVLTTNPARVA